MGNLTLIAFYTLVNLYVLLTLVLCFVISCSSKDLVLNVCVLSVYCVIIKCNSIEVVCLDHTTCALLL